MRRALFLSVVVAALACVEQPIGDPAGDNNYDDPDDPGQNGQGSSGPDASGDANGRACVADRDCPAAFACAYPIAGGCGATGTCMPYPDDPTCTSRVACGCDGTEVPLCAPQGYATAPVTSAIPCDGGVVDASASDASDATDAGTDDASSGDASVNDASSDAASE